MKATITIEFRESDAKELSERAGGADVGQILRDALGEFVSVRTPTAVYVAKRYAHMSEGFQSFQLREVAKRVAMAALLQRGDVTIHVEAGR